MNFDILLTTAMNKRRLGALSGCERKAHGGLKARTSMVVPLRAIGQMEDFPSSPV
jgi:hypothetical protein